MGGTVANKRLFRITAGNLRNNHIYINGQYDFFPKNCLGPSKRGKQGAAHAEIEIYLDGLDKTVSTDISRDRNTGKPRNFFRRRAWVRHFFEYHRIKTGDVLAMERLGERSYRLSVDLAEQPASLTCAEFFAGIGLVRLALERQGWQVVFANDIDPKKAAMYQANWPRDDRLFVGDIHALKADDLPTCDLFTASFPCNDLSIAGRWEGLQGKESSSFWGLIRLLHEMGDRRPPLVMLENVVGFLMSHGGRDFEKALLALNELGYAVDAIILNAARWVPQSRPRLFVLAGRDDGRAGRSCTLVSDARPPLLTDFINGHPNIRWNIRDVPPLPPAAARLADIIEDLPNDDPHWWNEKRTSVFSQAA